MVKPKRVLTVKDESEDTFLHTPSARVEDPKDPELKNLFEEMFATAKHEDGIGIAAPQIGVALKVIAVTLPNQKFILMNPEIVWSSRKQDIIEEGCLSVPGKYGPVRRPIAVKVHALNDKGDPVVVKADGLSARVLQHEIDHINGTLYIDRIAKQ